MVSVMDFRIENDDKDEEDFSSVVSAETDDDLVDEIDANHAEKVHLCGFVRVEVISKL